MVCYGVFWSGQLWKRPKTVADILFFPEILIKIFGNSFSSFLEIQKTATFVIFSRYCFGENGLLTTVTTVCHSLYLQHFTRMIILLIHIHHNRLFSSFFFWQEENVKLLRSWTAWLRTKKVHILQRFLNVTGLWGFYDRFINRCERRKLRRCEMLRSQW